MALLSPLTAQAQDYPNHYITLIVPLAPGSGTDAIARLVAARLGDVLGKQIVVENKVGANGAIGTAAAARAAPDGYTLLVGGTTTHAGNPNLMKTITYNPVTDFTPVGQLGVYPYALLVSGSSPYATMADLVAAAKAKPGTLSFAYANALGQLSGEMLKQRASIDVTAVAYRGSPQAITDIIGGRVNDDVRRYHPRHRADPGGHGTGIGGDNRASHQRAAECADNGRGWAERPAGGGLERPVCPGQDAEADHRQTIRGVGTTLVAAGFEEADGGDRVRSRTHHARGLRKARRGGGCPVGEVDQAGRAGTRIAAGKGATMTDETVYELYAIRYAGNTRRHRGHNFILADDPERLEPMDYFSWVAIGPDGAIVIDTGLREAKALQRGYDYVRPPHAILPSLGVDPASVRTVVLTHMHYDHIGNLDAFPNARFHAQAAEMAYVTGPLMAKPWFRQAYEVDEIQQCIAYLHAGRLNLHGAEAEIAPGLTVHLVGGHCAGQEVVRVRTRRGWVVLASDALHYDEELERSVPFAVAYSIADMMLAHDRLVQLAGSRDHIVPSHEPAVMLRYPAPRPDLEGIVIRLDVAPSMG